MDEMFCKKEELHTSLCMRTQYFSIILYMYNMYVETGDNVTSM